MLLENTANKKPLVSIIITTLNCQEKLPLCLGSIITQSFKDFEIVIQDGGSTDETLSIVNQLKNEHDVLLNVYQENDSGIYDAMNLALENATGDWIFFLGADDRLYNNNTLKDTFQDDDLSDYNMLYGNVEIVGNTTWAVNGEIYDGEFTIQKLLTKNICHQCIFYKKSFFKTLGGFNTRYRVCADWDFNLRCFAKGKIKYIPQTIAYFHSGGLSSRNESDGFYNDLLFNAKAYLQVSYTNSLFHTINDAFHLQARLFFKEKKYLQAVRFLLLYYYHRSFSPGKSNRIKLVS